MQQTLKGQKSDIKGYQVKVVEKDSEARLWLSVEVSNDMDCDIIIIIIIIEKREGLMAVLLPVVPLAITIYWGLWYRGANLL